MLSGVECPICMDCITANINCVTTECGHNFHASCLLQNVAHNGYGCPCCRGKLADEQEDEDEDDEDDYSIMVYEQEEDDTLRAFRFFWNNVNGEEHSENDDADEDVFNEERADEDHSVIEEESVPVPSASFVAEKLQQQGVSYEQLVKLALMQHIEYDENEDFQLQEDDIFGKIRVVVSNYNPEQEVPSQPLQAPAIAESKERVTAEETEAESKSSSRRRSMIVN